VAFQIVTHIALTLTWKARIDRANRSQISLPTAVIDAMVAAGFLQTTDRSDGVKLADAIRTVIAAHLEPEIAQIRESASRKA
jgi:hypothetical protein